MISPTAAYRYIAWRLFDFGLRRWGRIDGPEINASLWLSLTAFFNCLTIADVVEATVGWSLLANVGDPGLLAFAVALAGLHYHFLVRSGAIEELDPVTAEWARSRPRAADGVFWGYLVGSMVVFFAVGSVI